MSSDLRFIDIPKDRAKVVAAIAEQQKQLALYQFLRSYFEQLPARKMNATLATKLHAALVDQAPDLVVQRVLYVPRKGLYSEGIEAGLVIYWHGMDERQYRVYQRFDYSFDLERMFSGDQQYTASIDHLTAVLAKFAYHAKKYNEALRVLVECSKIAQAEGAIFPSYPLSEMFGYYQLNRPNMPRAVDVPDTPDSASA